jgi:riboflavin kinase/FMN adenylyltransferase
MDILRASEPTPASWRHVSLALGNFDGVHLGHQSVLDAARETGAQLGAPLAVAVFEPHPRTYFHPDSPPFRLQSPAQRSRALSAYGIERVFEIGFTQDLAAMTPEAFARQILQERIGARSVAVGLDFRYGRDRSGDANRLRADGPHHGFAVRVVDTVDDYAAAGEYKVSSSTIREAIKAGDMKKARALLSRPWAIEGVVGPGQQRGRTINFPTANLRLGAYVRPCFGVYAVQIDVGDGLLRPGIANCGLRPTVSGDQEPLLEAHIFDFDSDLYGRRIEVSLIDFIRPELKFDSFQALTAQIIQDAQAARRALT